MIYHLGKLDRKKGSSSTSSSESGSKSGSDSGSKSGSGSGSCSCADDEDGEAATRASVLSVRLSEAIRDDSPGIEDRKKKKKKDKKKKKKKKKGSSESGSCSCDNDDNETPATEIITEAPLPTRSYSD